MRSVPTLALTAVAALGLSVLAGSTTADGAPAHGAPSGGAASGGATSNAPTAATAVWTASAATDVFRDTRPTTAAPTTLSLDAAGNSFQSGQILIRKDAAFTIRAVQFSTLTAGRHTLAGGPLSYRLVDYTHLNHNSVFGGNQPAKLLTRTAPGDFPDGLSGARHRRVAANTTQSIWVTAHTPKGAVAGRYTGTAIVITDHGRSTVPIALRVYPVSIPDSADSGFTTSLWSLTTGALSWDEGKGDTIELFYGERRYSRKWWQLMGHFADDMAEYRNNDLTVNVVRLLLDGGSTVDASGHYTFNWSRFDQYVRFFTDRHVVKQLEGYWMTGPALGRSTWQTETIGRDAHGRPTRQYVDWQSAQATGWTAQFLPALRQHLTARGWASRWWMHVSDEPTGGTAIANYKATAARTRHYWPGVRLADAVYDQDSAKALADDQSFLIPNELAHNPNAAFYDAQVAAGKPVWLYNCNIPTGMYLNRFVDQPQYEQRLTMWYAFEHGVTGYLHWAFNNWQYTVDDQDVKGDGYIVKPDRAHNTLEPTVRYESLRDGLQDWELLSLVGRRDPRQAQGLAHSLVTDATHYNRDTGYLDRVHRLLLQAAAGADRPAGAHTTTGSTVDLGRQEQIDAAGVTGAGTQRFEVSYDGQHWATAYTGDGRWAGLDVRGRYVRVSGGGTGLWVAGTPLPRPNLAGGRPYTVSEPPDADGSDRVSDRAATDGVPARTPEDDRAPGYTVTAGSSRTVELTVDLGAARPVADVVVARYPDGEQREAPDEVAVAVSSDGKAFVPKGHRRTPNGADDGSYDLAFPASTARWIRVSYTRTAAADPATLRIGEVEVWGPTDPADTDVALGAHYTKSAEPDDPMFPDTGGTESTDGIIGGDFTDRYSYAYYVGGGQDRTVTITVALPRPVAVDRVQLQAYDDGVHHWTPDTVTVSTRGDTGAFHRQGRASWPTGDWFDVAFPRTTVSTVQIALHKTDARFADYLFVDELAVLGDLSISPQQLAAHRPYTKTADGLDPAYPDSATGDSTDGVLAGGYPDHRSYGYDLAPGQTRTVHVSVDLGAVHRLSLVKIWRYNDGVHHYQPDRVSVATATEPGSFTDRGTSTQPDDRWFAVGLPSVQARYVQITATKTYGDFADYLFLDEIEIYGR